VASDDLPPDSRSPHSFIGEQLPGFAFGVKPDFVSRSCAAMVEANVHELQRCLGAMV
jgi:hypothetical protein